MNKLFAMLGKRSAEEYSTRLGLTRGMPLEPLEQRHLLSVNIPLYNGNFESPTVFVSNNSYTGVVAETVQPGPQGSWAADGQDQPANSNITDPRFGTPGWGKTAQGGGGPGENTEGIYGELNDTGSNQNVYYNLVNGQLPAPASGTGLFNIIPAPGGVYNVWVDQQPDTGSQNPGDSLSHYDLNYPAMIPATTAIAGHTYQVTAALGNPLVNGSAGLGASVELDFTTGAGTYNEPSGTNSATTPPQAGDNSLFYNGYGTTVASVTTDSTWNNLAAGSFRGISLQWTCPAQDAGMPLDIMFIFRCGTEQVSMDNVQLTDLTASSIIPQPASGLTATAASSSQVNLSWADTTGDETGFQIDRSTSSDFSQNLTSFTTSGTTTSYSDTSAAPNTTYYYRVWATNGGNLSATASNSASAMTSPGSYSVPNFSFENPAESSGGYSNNILTNWTIGTITTNETAGVQNNTSSSYFSSVPDGSQFAFINADSDSSGYKSSNTLTSSVLGTVGGGQTYTLTAALGNRGDVNYADNGTYTISLLDGGTVLASQTYAGSSIAPGTWHDLALAYTTPANVATGNLQIQLGFSTAGYTAGNVFGQGDFDNIRLASGTQATPPQPPTGLTATTISANQINLSWADTAGDETGFQIDRSTSSDFSQNLTSVMLSGTTTSYSDTSVAPGATYYYRVWAANGGTLSTTASNTASATTSGLVPISVPNFSFENPAQSNGGYSDNSLTNWTIGSTPGVYSAGVQNNTSAPYFSSVPDGSQFAYVNADSNGSYYASSDTLTSASLGTVAAGQPYTLTVAVGNRLDTPSADNGTYTISLLDSGTVLASQTYAGSSITPGTWHDLTLAYTTPGNVAAGNLQVQLGFSTAGYTAGNPYGQGDFDNVRLASGTQATRPQPPTSLTASAISSSQINLSWADTAGDETGFQIDRSTSSDFSQNLTSVTISGTTTSYSDTSVAVGTTYYYRVWATSGGNLSTTPSNTASATTSGTTPISVPNFSFENPAQSNGGYSDNSLTSWTIGSTPGVDTAGVQNNTSASYFSSVPDGSQFAYVNADSNGSYYASSDTLTSAALGTVAAGQPYTLTVAVGNRLDTPSADNGTYTISLLDGGTVLASQTYAGSSITPGTWHDLTLAYTTLANVAAGNLQVQLGFSTAGYTAGNPYGQGDFDNVRLTSGTPSPPPQPPTSLTATVSSNQINLSWADTAGDETGFQIDRSTSSDFSQNLTSVTISGTTTSYSDTTVAPGTTYYYRVWATGGGNLSTTPSNTASATTSGAVPVSVPNFSFENPAQSNGGYSNNTLTNWTIGTITTNDTAGVQNNTSASYFSSVPDGSQFAFINADSDSSAYKSSNTLTSVALGTVSGATTYTLTAALGNRGDVNYANNGTYTISLLDGGTVLASQTYAGSSITPGTWHDLTLAYTTPANVAAGNLQVQLGFSTAGYTAGNVMGQGDFDNVRLGTQSMPPQAPTGLTATAVSSNQINLSWADSASDETGLQIDRSTSSDFSQNLTSFTISGTTTSYSDTTVSPSTAYYYRVRATNNAGASSNTAAASATTPAPTAPIAPSGLTATAASSSQINLTWQDNSSNETGFKIDWATDSAFTQNLSEVTVGANVTNYSVTGLSPATAYYFRVRATNAVGDSANTSTVGESTIGTITIPDASFEQAATGQITSVPSSGTGTATAPITGSIPGWNVSITPTTYGGGAYNGWEPFAQVFPTDPSSGDYMASDDGSQHLSFYGGELFSGYPWQFGWPGYGIIPGQTDQLSSAAPLATSVAGDTYTATIAVADPLWQTVNHATFAQEVAQAQQAYGSGVTAAQVAANGVWIATPQFELDIVANGQVVGSATLAAATQASTEAGQAAAAGQWYTLTATWTATTSGQNITLQASASQIAEGAYNLGHTLQESEGPDPWTSTSASFDAATLNVSAPVAGSPAASSDTTSSSTSTPWQNPANPLDVQNTGTVTPMDALIVINYLNANGAGPLPATFSGSDYLDVNGDNAVTPLDALAIINYLNSSASATIAAVAVQSAATPSVDNVAAPAIATPVDGSLLMGVSLVSTAQPSSLANGTLASLSPAVQQVASTSNDSAADGSLNQAAVDSLLSVAQRRKADPAAQSKVIDALLADPSLDWSV